jgi:hypothetical protein
MVTAQRVFHNLVASTTAASNAKTAPGAAVWSAT